MPRDIAAETRAAYTAPPPRGSVIARAVAGAALAVAIASGVVAQSPAPSPGPVAGSSPGPVAGSSAGPSSSPTAWPSGDELRRELQLIRFDFQVDGDTGEWLGWPPRAGSDDGPAMRLGGAGIEPATAAFELDLLGGDPGPALSAFLEVSSRLPLAHADVDAARRFVVDDLLQEPPETLEDCYLSDWNVGAMLVVLAADGTVAELRLAPDPGRLSADADLDLELELELADCAALVPSEVVSELSDPVSERLSITISGDPPAFVPSATTIEAPLLTLIVSVTNETASEQTLSFEAPLAASTGPIDPGERKLIVVREIEPGEYAFSSDADPEAIRGTLEVVAPGSGGGTD